MKTKPGSGAPNIQIANEGRDRIRTFDATVKRPLTMRKPPKEENKLTRDQVLGPVKDPELIYNTAEGISNGNPIYNDNYRR